MSERKQREFRLTEQQGGSWGTISAWYFHSVELVFRESKKAAAGSPARPSRWVFAGLPVLIAGVEAFLIEHQHLLRSNSGDRAIAGVDPIGEVLRLYPLSDEQAQDIDALIDVRNQIVHPSQVAFGKAEWPRSLQRLRDRKVLEGKTPQSGTDVMALLENHSLFAWAVERCAEVLSVVAESDERAELFRDSVFTLWRVLQE